MTSAYKVAGFTLNGGYQYNDSNTLTPEFLTEQMSEHSNTSANSFSFGIGHNLPWNGSFSCRCHPVGPDHRPRRHDVHRSIRYQHRHGIEHGEFRTAASFGRGSERLLHR